MQERDVTGEILGSPLGRRAFLGRAGLAGGALALPGWGQARRAATPNWAPVQAMLDGFVGLGRLPGAAGAVARGTDPARYLAAGTLARDSTRRVDADALFRVYSMTKPITGMAAMMLIEDKKLGLDQDIGDFIPGFKRPMVAIDPVKSLDARPAARPVTVRMLMTHSAGLGYIIVNKGRLLDEYVRLGLTGGLVSRQALPGFAPLTPAPTLAAYADRIASLPLVLEPGTQWRYSAGLDVLGRVIEVASGMPFDVFLRTRMFEPLGMASTFFRVPASELARMTTNYGIVGPAQVPIDPGATTIFADANPLPLGGSGLVTSPRDYDRFLLMLAGRGRVGQTRVMNEATVRLGMSNLLPPGASTAGTYVAGQGYGAGGRVTIAPDPRGSGLGTFGWGGAAATIGFVDPTRGVRASGFAQFMPDQTIPFTIDFARSVYASL